MQDGLADASSVFWITVKKDNYTDFSESYFKGELLLFTTQACNSLQLNKIFILAS